MPELTATLLINITSSRCGNCGQNTLPEATHHTDVSGWSPRQGAGCGALFVDTDTDYPHITDDDLLRVRPDLPVRTA